MILKKSKQKLTDNKRETGSYYEKIAQRLLEINGYIIVQCNFRCRFGEVDIIAQKEADGGHGTTLVFVEVKYRKNDNSGWPEEAVTREKQKRIVKVAEYYCRSYKPEYNFIRFDVVSIIGNKYRIIENAFGYIK